MKEYIKPEINDEDIELEDIVANSLGENVEEEYNEESGDQSIFPWS